MTTVRSAVLLASILASGCAPIPNFRYYAPAVSGVVTQDGVPVANAEIRISDDFTEEIQRATTSQTGLFATEPIRKFLLTASLIGDPLYSYSVEIMINGNKYIGYSEAGVGYAPNKVEFKCELSRPIQIGRQQFYCSPVNEVN